MRFKTIETTAAVWKVTWSCKPTLRSFAVSPKSEYTSSHFFFIFVFYWHCGGFYFFFTMSLPSFEFLFNYLSAPLYNFYTVVVFNSLEITVTFVDFIIILFIPHSSSYELIWIITRNYNYKNFGCFILNHTNEIISIKVYITLLEIMNAVR